MAKRPRWADDDWIGTGPDLEKISCKDCAFRAEDREYKGKVIYNGAELGMCDVYENKPPEILMGNVKCPYYLSQYDEGPESEE